MTSTPPNTFIWAGQLSCKGLIKSHARRHLGQPLRELVGPEQTLI